MESTAPYPVHPGYPGYGGPAGYPGYPVRVDAQLDPRLSRWLWLFKWLLAIPHYVVLFFLWIGVWLVSIVAFVAILITGRYPRPLFGFTLGVLRWTWRVAYYSYGALGTDRYPPFSLAEVPDYPAHLHVPYPEHLSRGLVLVKWWLLAIPHYLVLAVFLGSAYTYTGNLGTVSVNTGGLLGLLVFFAAVALLFTGRYPDGIYGFVLGMNRWVLRVAAYAWLLTDAYPPFRLDTGPTDPTSPVVVPPPQQRHGTISPPTTEPAPAPPPRSAYRPPRA